MSRKSEAWIRFFATRMVGAIVDLLTVAAAYLAAFVLRFDFAEPRWGWSAVAHSFLLVGVVHLVSLVITGCYRLSWRRIRITDAPRYVLSTVLAAAVLTVLRLVLSTEAFAHVRPPYSVTVICFFFASAGILLSRLIWRAYWHARADEDRLLERDARSFDNSSAAKFLAGRVVMVTGAGGSIGAELVRQVAAAGAAKVLMVERGENALYEIDRRMAAGGGRFGASCLPLMIDINEREKIAAVFAKYRPEVVIHAAAYKHVPMVEANPEEGWRNNTEATKLLAELAREHGVRRFVLISTDKAVNPVSVMGKTKLAAEQAIMSMNASQTFQTSETSFCAVRFGNVLGSSGSVVPLFREQIAKGGPLTVTHPDMIRYFMTIREAVSLVLSATARSEKAIYTLDMGRPVRILDLAEGMISQAGYRPYVDIPIVFTGIRPGEKLFEEIDVSEKNCYKTDMAKIYITK